MKKILLTILLLSPLTSFADTVDNINSPCSPDGKLTIINEKSYKCSNHKWVILDTSLALPYGQTIMNQPSQSINRNPNASIPQTFTNANNELQKTLITKEDHSVNSNKNGHNVLPTKSVNTIDKIQNNMASHDIKKSKTHDLRNCFAGGFIGGRMGWRWHKHPLEGGVAGCWTGIATGRMLHH